MLNKFVIISLTIVLLFSFTLKSDAKFSEWNKLDKTLGASYITLVGADILQTRNWDETVRDKRIMWNVNPFETPDLTFDNPLLHNQTLKEKIAIDLFTTYVGYKIADSLEPKARRTVLIIANLIKFNSYYKNQEKVKRLTLFNIGF